MTRIGINDLGRFLVPQGGWSQTGMDCYLRGCVCKGCLFESGFYNNRKEKHSCQMKASVLEMVRVFGAPTKENTKLNRTAYNRKI